MKMTTNIKLRWQNLIARLGDWLLQHNSPILLRHTYQAALADWRYRESVMTIANDAERKMFTELIGRARAMTIDIRPPERDEIVYQLIVTLSPQIVTEMFVHGDQSSVRYVVRHLMVAVESELLTINFARLPRNSRGDARLYPPGTTPPESSYRD